MLKQLSTQYTNKSNDKEDFFNRSSLPVIGKCPSWQNDVNSTLKRRYPRRTLVRRYWKIVENANWIDVTFTMSLTMLRSQNQRYFNVEATLIGRRRFNVCQTTLIRRRYYVDDVATFFRPKYSVETTSYARQGICTTILFNTT